MIKMDEANFHDQPGMERAFSDYFEEVLRQYPGTVNAMLDAHLHSCDYEGKWVILTVLAQPWMANPAGIVHGGVSATCLDMTLGMLCRYFSGGKIVRTIHVDVSYLRAVPLGIEMCIRAEITKMGAGVCFAAGSLWEKGKPERPLTTCVGSYSIADPE